MKESSNCKWFVGANVLVSKVGMGGVQMDGNAGVAGTLDPQQKLP